LNFRTFEKIEIDSLPFAPRGARIFPEAAVALTLHLVGRHHSAKATGKSIRKKQPAI